MNKFPCLNKLPPKYLNLKLFYYLLFFTRVSNPVTYYINYIQSYLIYILLIINNFILRYIFNFSSNITAVAGIALTRIL